MGMVCVYLTLGVSRTNTNRVSKWKAMKIIIHPVKTWKKTHFLKYAFWSFAKKNNCKNIITLRWNLNKRMSTKTPTFTCSFSHSAKQLVDLIAAVLFHAFFFPPPSTPPTPKLFSDTSVVSGYLLELLHINTPLKCIWSLRFHICLANKRGVIKHPAFRLAWIKM